jgi:hypothetical protein
MSHARRCVVSAMALTAITWFSLGRAQDDSDAADDGDEAESADKITPAEMAQLEKQFAQTMSGAMLNGLATVVNSGKIVNQIPDSYRLGKVSKVDDKGHWKFEYYIAGTELLYEMPPLKVQWAGETPLIIFSGIKIKGKPGTFTAKLLIDGDQYSGTWSDGENGGHLVGLIVHEKAKKGKKAKDDDQET